MTDVPCFQKIDGKLIEGGLLFKGFLKLARLFPRKGSIEGKE
jgi:hypothetical protein